jgi:uncharacterized membrane protein
MKTNQAFKNEALAALRGNWGKAVLATLLYVLLISLVNIPVTYQSFKMQSYLTENAGSHASLYDMASLMQDPAYQLLSKRTNGYSSLSTLVSILLIMPLSLGYANAMRRLLVHQEDELISNTIRIAFRNYWHKVWGLLWMTILIFLWSLLLIVPGLIKSFSYAMTPFILEDNPELSGVEAIHRSRMMMKGHKFDLFWLWLSFIGWFLLSILTCGIGFLWLVPYMETAQAAFYEEVKADYALNGGLD